MIGLIGARRLARHVLSPVRCVGFRRRPITRPSLGISKLVEFPRTPAGSPSSRPWPRSGGAFLSDPAQKESPWPYTPHAGVLAVLAAGLAPPAPEHSSWAAPAHHYTAAQRGRLSAQTGPPNLPNRSLVRHSVRRPSRTCNLRLTNFLDYSGARVHANVDSDQSGINGRYRS